MLSYSFLSVCSLLPAQNTTDLKENRIEFAFLSPYNCSLYIAQIIFNYKEFALIAGFVKLRFSSKLRQIVDVNFVVSGLSSLKLPKQNTFQIKIALFSQQSRMKSLPLHDKQTAVLWKLVPGLWPS